MDTITAAVCARAWSALRAGRVFLLCNAACCGATKGLRAAASLLELGGLAKVSSRNLDTC